MVRFLLFSCFFSWSDSHFFSAFSLKATCKPGALTGPCYNDEQFLFQSYFDSFTEMYISRYFLNFILTLLCAIYVSFVQEQCFANCDIIFIKTVFLDPKARDWLPL